MRLSDRPNEIRGKLLQSQKFKSVNSYHLRYFVSFPLLDSSTIGISPWSEKLVCSYGTEMALYYVVRLILILDTDSPHLAADAGVGGLPVVHGDVAAV